MYQDDAPRKKSDAIRPGEDLSDFSIEGLEERKSLLEEEIKRIEETITSKQIGREAAEAVFKI